MSIIFKNVCAHFSFFFSELLSEPLFPYLTSSDLSLSSSWELKIRGFLHIEHHTMNLPQNKHYVTSLPVCLQGELSDCLSQRRENHVQEKVPVLPRLLWERRDVCSWVSSHTLTHKCNKCDKVWLNAAFTWGNRRTWFHWVTVTSQKNRCLLSLRRPPMTVGLLCTPRPTVSVTAGRWPVAKTATVGQQQQNRTHYVNTAYHYLCESCCWFEKERKS